MTKLIVCGVFGRMGRAVCELARDDNDVTVAAGVVRKLGGENTEFPVFVSVSDVDIEADCVVSFLPPSAHKESLQMLDYCMSKKKPAVICTTGLSETVLEKIQKASKCIAIIHSANMSYGIGVLTDFLQWAAKRLYDEGFDIEIVESHHNKKLDAPSGTALVLYDAVNSALESPLELACDRSQRNGARARGEMGIQTVRGGGIFGEHKVLFAGAHETIEITHNALGREVFADGAIKAAKCLVGKPPGLYKRPTLNSPSYTIQ